MVRLAKIRQALDRLKAGANVTLLKTELTLNRTKGALALGREKKCYNPSRYIVEDLKDEHD